jgi:nucleoside-diphosphate-sugar epimerase
MHVFIAGASGAVGRSLIPHLVERGHEVTATTRSAQRAAELEALGAHAAIVDGLDRDAVVRAVRAASPDAIVHQMTALRGMKFGRFDKTFAQTNRLRTEGTDHLLAAARAAGVERFVAQSYAGWPYERTGGPVKGEDAPLQDPGPRGARESLAAIRHVERATREFGGVVLRYGGFYGPGTGITHDGEQVELLRRRRFPLTGDGAGVWSFCHVADAASATALALERARPGSVYNVCDDEPAPVREWLPFLARAAGAPAPRRVPLWLVRMLAGEAGVALLTDARGADNARAKAELGWAPRWATWRDGFPAALASEPGASAPAGAVDAARGG